MRPLRVLSLLLAALMFLISACGTRRPLPREEAEQRAAKGGRHALLIGCTDYPNLDPNLRLAGPGNDVQLMARALRELFGFAPESIVTLSDEAAKTKRDDRLLPTRANIRREFERLAKAAREGDKVVIL